MPKTLEDLSPQMRKTKEFLRGGRGNLIATGYFRIWGLFEALPFISAFKLSKTHAEKSLMWPKTSRDLSKQHLADVSGSLGLEVTHLSHTITEAEMIQFVLLVRLCTGAHSSMRCTVCVVRVWGLDLDHVSSVASFKMHGLFIIMRR